MKINTSADFKKSTTRSILSIILFAVVYILMIVFAAGLTIAFGYAGFYLIILRPSLITIVAGLGLASAGVLILIFLMKFIFKKNTTDRSNLIEITKEEEPELFRFIGGIVDEVQTDFPKKIYLSSDVNAAVFYDSSFFSMFLPVRKNLQIGLGLVNSVTELEFKAIMAHEFGHFSQRTMKVGSYVYNVNKVIFNMLYDNQSYRSLAERWAGIHGIVSWFVFLAVKIVQGIQWILKKIYDVVNLNYMSLSREMEFQADEVAANVAGSRPLINSLLRSDLANHSFQSVLDYYNEKYKDSLKTTNIYPQQLFVMHFLANESKLKIENDLPHVTLDYLGRYNKSKLVVKDQWASHPGTEERVARLQQLNLERPDTNPRPASSLFKNPEQLQARVTKHLFSFVEYTGASSDVTTQEFTKDFTLLHNKRTFSKIYNGYYDSKNPSVIEFRNISENTRPLSTPADLFGEEAVEKTYIAAAIEMDINTLQQIINPEVKIKSFDYDGQRYKKKNAPELIITLETELKRIKAEIHKNDIEIYRYFLEKELLSGNEKQLQRNYQAFYDMDKAYDNKIKLSARLTEGTEFIQYSTNVEEIESNLDAFVYIERELKNELRYFLVEAQYKEAVTNEIEDSFQLYLAKEYTYFYGTSYNDEALKILFAAINNYQLVLVNSFIHAKRDLLNYQAGLV